MAVPPKSIKRSMKCPSMYFTLHHTAREGNIEKTHQAKAEQVKAHLKTG